MYTVGFISSGWSASIVEENLGVQDKVQQDGLVLAARTTVLVHFERRLK
jgi:hypothetical protein